MPLRCICVSQSSSFVRDTTGDTRKQSIEGDKERLLEIGSWAVSLDFAGVRRLLEAGRDKLMVRTERLELSHLAALEPKSSVSTNFTTSALLLA